MERRSSPRRRVLFVASVEVADTVRPVRLVDLSVEGASLVADELPPVGSLIRLRRKDVRTDARVVWASGRQGGVEFQKPVPPNAMVRSVARPENRSFIHTVVPH